MAQSANNWKGPQPAPRYLGRLLRANFPQITATGIYNDRNVAGTTKKSSHAEGRAIDIHLSAADPEQKVIGDRLFDAIIHRARSMGVDNAIWNKQIWSTKHPTKRGYHGQSAHTDHIHVEFTRDGSQFSEKQLLRAILIDVGILRTGLEEIHQAQANIG